MADPVAWGQIALAKYGPTAAGLLIGTAAKYGLTLTEGRRLTWVGALSDVLLLGMLGFLAVVVSDAFALTGNARVLAGALAAVSSDRLVRLVRDRFLQRADRDLIKSLSLPPDAQAEMRSTDQPRRPLVRLRTTPGTPLRSELRDAFPPPTGHDPVADHLIGKLDDDI